LKNKLKKPKGAKVRLLLMVLLHLLVLPNWCESFKRKENPIYKKIKDKNPSIKSTRQKKAQVDTTQRKNES
jgi:hypothetical protein